MKMKKTQEVEIEVEKYTYKNITVWFEDDCYLKRSEGLAKSIAIILERKNKQAGDLTYFLYDLERLYRVSSTDDIFDVIDDAENWCWDYLSTSENIEAFLEEKYNNEDFISKLCDPQNSKKLCEKIIDEMLVEKNAVLTEDGTVLTIS